MNNHRAHHWKAVLLLAVLLTACGPELQETSSASQSPPPAGSHFNPTPEITHRPTLFLQSTATLAPTHTSLPPPASVVLISWDGAGADMVHRMMEEGILPTFKAVADRGLRAEFALSVDPSLTAPAHNSIASGSNPARTGIVSNRFHVSDDSFYWYRSGFYEPMDQAEPVWITASRAGYTTATVFFAGGTPDIPGQMADYTIGFGERDAYSSQQTIILGEAKPWENPPDSYSLLLEGSFSIPEVSRVYALVSDSSDDGVLNYDTVHLNTQPRVDDKAIHLAVGEWGSLVLVPETYSGADFLIQNIAPGYVTLYHTAANHNLASPPDLLRELNGNFGFFPAGPDGYALGRGWIGEEDYLHMLSRSSRWMAEVTAWVYQRYQPHVLFTWQGAFDYAGHAFTLQDERQEGYSIEEANLCKGYLQQAAGSADEALKIMLGAIDLDRTTLFLVSDHGVAPVHTKVYINTVLEQAGLLTLDRKNYVIVEKTRAMAVTSGGSANITINLRGREKDGIVSVEDYPAIQSLIVELLSSLTDPDTGEPVFQRILTREELFQLGLHHPNTGDIFVQANPGYELDGWRGMKKVFEPSSYRGHQGYDALLPEMHAIFIAVGAGIPVTGEVIPPVAVIDYAPTIAALLGFEPARSVDGEPIPAIVR